MFLLKSLRSQQSHTYLKPLINPTTHSTRFFPLISPKTLRPISTFPDLERQDHFGPKCPGRRKRGNRRPLDVVFKEAVGLIERSENVDEGFEIDDEGEVLKKRLTELEIELRELKGKPKVNNLRRKLVRRDNVNDAESRPSSLSSLFSSNDSSKSVRKGFMEERDKLTVKEYPDGSKPKGLSSLFSDNNNSKVVKKKEHREVVKEKLMVKEYSEDMHVFLKHLYDEGCLKNAQFLTGGKFALSSFESYYARDFVKFAAEKYGEDKQEIAKWLSGSDLKTIALFGCPSCEKKNVFSAKRLRSFFKIPENTICSTCTLKGSCKFVNQNVWNGDTNQLRLAPVMRLLTVYSMEAVSSQLVLSDDLKASVSRLIKDVINLSKTSG